jgi:hypothetical protein
MPSKELQLITTAYKLPAILPIWNDGELLSDVPCMRRRVTKQVYIRIVD